MRILQRLLIALCIIGVCTIFSLHILGVIRIHVFDHAKFKISVTAVVFGFVLIYFIYKKRVSSLNWKHFTLLSIICEAIGFWWLDNPIGYLMIILGFVFLVGGFILEYKDKTKT